MKIGPAEKQEQFTQGCHYIGMKLLAEQYHSMMGKAGEDTPGYFEFIHEIVQAESADKLQRHIVNLIKKSKLPKPLKILEDFDFQAILNRPLILDLASLNFIEWNASVLLIACQKEYRTYYTTLSDLINDLNAWVYEKTLEKRTRKYINPELLVIDEIGHDRLELQVVKEVHLLFIGNRPAVQG